ncbi:MAG: isochorismate synthase MenF [Acidimicrobiales bacterium]
MNPTPPATLPVTLTATAFRIDTDIDLPELAGPDGMVITRNGSGLGGTGCAATIEVPAGQRHRAAALVHEVLSAIERVGPPNAPAPVAFGALPVDPAAAARLLVPALQLHRHADGTRWAVVIAPAVASPPSPPSSPSPPWSPSSPFTGTPTMPAAALLPAPRPALPPPGRIEIATRHDPSWWMDQVAAASARIRAGELRKVVLARELILTADRELDPRPILRRLISAYPACYVSFIDGFVCASPELLVSRHGDVVRAHPMAGTAPRLADPAADARQAAALLSNASYRREHQLTIDMVHETLLGWCSFLDAEPEPSVVAMANVSHLATMVEGRLSRPEPSVLELVTALHPTPAVGGVPGPAALAMQRELEDIDRLRYAGPVGWVDADGNGDWAVGVRAAELIGATAHVYAGNGIVADSDPATELAETQAKFAAMLGALVRL